MWWLRSSWRSCIIFAAPHESLIHYIQTLENIFICDGETGHEIVIVYEGEFADKTFYNKDVVILTEDNGEKLKAMWMPLADFRARKFPLYPNGLLELLAKKE